MRSMLGLYIQTDIWLKRNEDLVQQHPVKHLRCRANRLLQQVEQRFPVWTHCIGDQWKSTERRLGHAHQTSTVSGRFAWSIGAGWRSIGCQRLVATLHSTIARTGRTLVAHARSNRIDCYWCNHAIGQAFADCQQLVLDLRLLLKAWVVADVISHSNLLQMMF